MYNSLVTRLIESRSLMVSGSRFTLKHLCSEFKRKENKSDRLRVKLNMLRCLDKAAKDVEVLRSYVDKIKV